MDCLACGAPMRLMQVDQRGDPSSEVAFEHHTFKCSACAQVSQRLVFSRPRAPLDALPISTPSAGPPHVKLQMRRAAAQSALAKVGEKLRSRRMAARGRASVAMASMWQEGLEKLQNQVTPAQPEARPVQELRSTSAALDRSAIAASNPTWAKVVEKVRTRQIALQDRASSRPGVSASSPHVREAQNSEDLGESD